MMKHIFFCLLSATSAKHAGAQTIDCNTATLCQECVVGRCAWSADMCLDSCDEAEADVDCFTSRNYAGSSPDDICALAEPTEMANATDVQTSNNATSSDPCNEFPACEPCLNSSRIDCTWTADSCQSCLIADAACYHPSGFSNMTGPEICAIFDESEEAVAVEAEDEMTSALADSAAGTIPRGLKMTLLGALLLAAVVV